MEALLYPETGATFLNPRTPFPTARTARGPIMLRNVHRSSEPALIFPLHSLQMPSCSILKQQKRNPKIPPQCRRDGYM